MSRQESIRLTKKEQRNICIKIISLWKPTGPCPSSIRKLQLLIKTKVFIEQIKLN